ncbi:hypothetical protein LCGC14_0953650 [marine sediment metagenome]|uniref:Uncharacterized protein n=1 Tax=marine sediment metagenome TaxID=412755 RepID=A0A0F9NGH1_9ZZZZ
MVSIQEARSIVDRNRQQLRQQQQQVDTARKNIEETRLRELSRQELQVRSLQEKLEREKSGIKLEGLKGQELKKLSPIQKDLDTARKQIDTFDAQVKSAEVAEAKQKATEAAFEKARNIFLSKDPRAIFALETREERKFFKQLQAERKTSIEEAIKKGKEELVIQGFKLKNIKEITKKGELFPSTLQVVSEKALIEKLKPVRVEPVKKLSIIRRLKIRKPEKITIRKLPPRPLTTRKINFGNPREFAKSFNQATGSKSFTIAIPLRRENGKIFVQDFSFKFKDGRIVKTKPLSSGLVSEDKFLAADKRRRDRNPGFTFGDTRITKPILLKKTDIQKVSTAIKEFFIGRGGEEAVAIGLKPFKTKVTGRQIRDFLRTKGIGGKVAGEFIPTRPQDVLLLVTLGGLISAGTPLISKGTVLGLQAFGALNALDTEKPPETRIAGTIVAIAPFFSTKKGDIPIFPKGKKGQAGRFQLLEDFFKKQDKKKADLDKVQTNLQFKQVGKKIVDKTTTEKIADIRKIFDKIRETKDPKLRKLQVDGAITFLERTYGRKGAQILFRDFIEQEGFILKPKQDVPNVFQKFVQKESATLGKQKLSKVKVKEPEVFFVSSAQQTKQKERQKQRVITTQADLLVQGQTFFQATKEVQKLAEETKTKQKVAQSLFSALVSAQRPRLKDKVGKAIRILKKPTPIFKLPKGVKQTDLIRAIQKLGKKNAVDIIVGMKLKKRKVIGKRLPPFKALRKAQKFVDKNIEASFLLKPTGKKSKQKDIKPFNASFKFRPSKVNPLFQVERRKFRLDSPTEVRQLKIFKGKIPRGIFPKIKKKRKKK